MEFAVIAWIHFAFILGIVEIGIATYFASMMDYATQVAARQVFTGQVQASGNPLNTFQTAFCNTLVGASCSGFVFDVRNFPDFTAIRLPPITFDNKGNPTNASFQPGGPQTVVTVRVIYNYQFYTPLIASLMAGGSGNSLQLTSTAVLKTEPFPG